MPNVDITPHSLSLWNLFIEADWIVKGVILGLLFASLWSWSIMFSKWMALTSLNRAARRLQEVPIQLDTWKEQDARWSVQEPFTQMVDIVAREYQKHPKGNGKKEKEFMIHRLEQMLSIRIDQQRESLSKQMGVLASVGSTAPFVGLFGTVWGIMNSFQCIAASKSSSLAVVAPGIAEALFATAIGLVVAIPAVIAYNRLTLAINTYIVGLENFSQELTLRCFQSTESTT